MKVKNALRRWTASLAVLALFVAPAALAGPAYTDVSEDAYYYMELESVTAQGWMNGTGGQQFAPELPATRAMFVTALWRMAGCPAAGETVQFSDVAPGAYYEEAVRWASGAGVLSGYPDGTFAPDATISRQDASTIFWRCAGEPEADRQVYYQFPGEREVAGYAHDAVAWAAMQGILLTGKMGSEDAGFFPRGPVTRGALARMLFRYDDYLTRTQAQG